MNEFDRLGTQVQGHLSDALQVAVLLHAAEMKHWPWSDIQQAAKDVSQILAEKGDLLMYRSKKKGETAAVFNAFARGVTALSFCPGGCTVFGVHYENQLEEGELECPKP